MTRVGGWKAFSFFHALTWTMTVAGLARRCTQRCPWSGKTLVGSLFLGWGMFNCVEGVIDHHILNIITSSNATANPSSTTPFWVQASFSSPLAF